MYDVCMTKRGDDLYVMPDLVSVFPFPSNIISTIFTKDYLQATFLTLSQLSLSQTNSTLNHWVTAQP